MSAIDYIREMGYDPFDTVHKFAYLEDLDSATSEVWSYGATLPEYVFITGSAESLMMASTSAADTQPMLLAGLDGGWAYQSLVTSLNGQTPVFLTGSSTITWQRVFRAYNQSSVNADLAGTVYFFLSGSSSGGVPTDPANVKAVIPLTIAGMPKVNQTMMSHFALADGVTGWLTNFEYSLIRSGAAGEREISIGIARREFGGVFRHLHAIGINNTGGGAFSSSDSDPIKIPPKADLMVVANAFDNNCSISANYDIILSVPLGGDSPSPVGR